MPNSSIIIAFIVPKTFKDDVTDHLMRSDISSGFNLTPIMGFSQKHSSYNLEEQVRGYKDMLQFEVLIENDKLEILKKELATLFPTTKVKYWVTPIIETDHL